MKTTNASGSQVMASIESITMDGSSVQAMRHSLHELANVFTGVMIAGGLLAQFLEAGSLQHYASNICESSERGSALVREIRGQLLASCGEAAIVTEGNSAGSTLGQ
jgi:nitrogen-specific signal transduction histidine kinase